MNIQELANFRLAKAIDFNTDLNPQLFKNEEMRPPVRLKLAEIADHFREFLGVQNMALVDIEVSGSNAAYSYTPHSDIDLHLIVDFTQLPEGDVYKELFTSKQYQYNDMHNIKIKGYDVELYVQDAAQAHHSLGSYSVKNDEWNRIPTKQRANLDDTATVLKYAKLKDLAIRALASDNERYLTRVLDIVKKYRQSGLDQHGEFGPENLAFKMLRTDGYFEKLWAKKRSHTDQSLSLETRAEEPDTLAQELMAEFAAELNEHGRIVKGVNTTCDVDVDEIKVQAKKMGFDVDIGGVPEIPKNGVPKLFEGIEQLDEYSMAPGRLQKEVNRILKSVDPMIGVEFEVIVPRDEEANPNITEYTRTDDIVEFFTHDSDDDFIKLYDRFNDWLNDKQEEWTHKMAQDALNNPSEETGKKIEYMVDTYSNSGDADDIVADITEDENDTEITTEMAEDAIARADQIYKANGPADEWPTPSYNSDPFVRLYYEIFVDDSEETMEVFKDLYRDDFYSNIAYDNNYSVGTWLRKNHINSMGDVYREFADDLTWPGGPMSGGEFDEELAYQIGGGLEDIVNDEVIVANDFADPDTSENWTIKSDASIKANNEEDSGLEIITPILEYTGGIKTLEEVFNHLKDMGAYANESTAIHINVSLANVEHDNLNYPKLVVMLGDAHILKQYGREFSEYAVNALTKLGSMMDANQGYSMDKDEVVKQYAALMGKMKGDFNNAVASTFGNIDFGKFSSIGIKEGYIEFRAAGGSNYLDNFTDIVTMINRFVISYAVACDPEAYKKEYGKKLYKLVSNVGKGQVPTSSMELFARFSSGMISKDELIRKIKAGKIAKAEEPVDNGQPAPSADVIKNAIEEIASNWEIPAIDAMAAWNAGMEVEWERFSDSSELLRKRRAAKEVFTNLKMDIEHYQ